MLKEYLKNNNISVYRLAKVSGIPYSTLNDLSNGKVGIDKCRVSLLHSLSAALGITMDETFDICSCDKRIIPNSYGVNAELYVRAKHYFALFTYNNEAADLELCSVTDDNTFYIEDIARWRIESYIREKRMEAFV